MVAEGASAGVRIGPVVRGTPRTQVAWQAARFRVGWGHVPQLAGKKNPSRGDLLADSFRMPLVSIVSPEGKENVR
jgi:hypothetical protein